MLKTTQSLTTKAVEWYGQL